MAYKQRGGNPLKHIFFFCMGLLSAVLSLTTPNPNPNPDQVLDVAVRNVARPAVRRRALARRAALRAKAEVDAAARAARNQSASEPRAELNVLVPHARQHPLHRLAPPQSTSPYAASRPCRPSDHTPWRTLAHPGAPWRPL